MTATLPDDFDPSTYTAFGSFAPVYTDAKRLLFERYPLDVARQCYFVLEALAQHAGPNGMLYRLSYRRLMKIAHIRYQAVQRALVILVYDMEWLREHRTTLPGRKQPIVDWQLSPHCLYIAQKHIEEALNLWRCAAIPDRKEVVNVSAWETQPESENQTQESKNRIQNQEPEYEPEQALKGKGRSPEKSRWREVSIEKCREPLSDQRREATAQAIAQAMKTTQTQARQMVATYGTERTLEKASEVQKQMSRKHVARPGALLLTYLRNTYGQKD